MRLLLALALAMGCMAAPAAADDDPARDLTRTGIPGAVVLSDDGVDAAGNVRATDRFRVGSVTKTFVSAVTLQLVAEGRLSLDEPVPEAGGIPLRMLLNHTSGIYNHSDDPRVFEHGLLKQWQPRELVAISRDQPPYFAPGKGFHYSNTNYVILGLVIERVTGRPLEAALERRWLPDTAYEESPDVRRLAPGPRQNTSWAGAAGALVSTARDLDRFYRHVVSSPRYAAMKTLDPVAGSYGLGLFKVQTSCGWFWGHNGIVPGYLAHAYTDGKRSAVVLVTGSELSKRQTAAVDRTLDKALCS
jgi:CubicO group peptidase (beta-lactamase class C family)